MERCASGYWRLSELKMAIVKWVCSPSVETSVSSEGVLLRCEVETEVDFGDMLTIGDCILAKALIVGKR